MPALDKSDPGRKIGPGSNRTEFKFPSFRTDFF
jgi:hypothetical protein